MSDHNISLFSIGSEIISRRALLTGSAAILAAASVPVAASAAPNPDAALIAACTEFDRLHQATFTFDPDDDDGFARLLDQRWEAADRAVSLSPTTEQGRTAQARVAWVLLEEAGDRSSRSDQVVLQALRHLSGGAA